MSQKHRTFLEKYVAYTSSYFYHDKVLKTLGYSFSSLAAVLRMLNDGQGSIVSESLDKLYNEIGMTRCLTRFVGTTDALEAIKNDSWAGDWMDKHLKPLAKLQAWTMVLYHPMEHIGWAAYIAPKLIRTNGDWWFSRACWFWTAYLVIDLYMCFLKMKELTRRKDEALQALNNSQNELEREQRQDILCNLQQMERSVKLQILRVIFYLPNSIHWSFIKPPFPKSVVAALGLAEAVVGLMQTFPKR